MEQNTINDSGGYKDEHAFVYRLLSAHGNRIGVTLAGKKIDN